MDNDTPPQMDKWTRNQRLYETLKEMGLFCTPIYEDEDRTKIDSIIVSVDLPSVPVDVVRPLERPKVGNVVTPAGRNGSNVVDFPPVF